MSAQSTSLAFQACHAVTARWEGGWSNHAADPGGKTMYGITEKVWLAWNKAKGISKPKPIRQITRAEAEEIYYHDYWLAARCNTLAAGVDMFTYDSSVNSGVSRARKWLLASVGGTDIETIKKMAAKRTSFLRALANFAVFGKGWINRVTDVEAQSIKRSLAESKVSSSTANAALKGEAEKAAGKAASATRNAQATAGGTFACGGGVTAVNADQADLIANWVLGGLLAAGAIVLAFFIVRSIVQKSRAKSLQEQAA
ncbi:hypothetical protein ELZ19_09620 [Brucella abortus]|uniref:glycoside hydrolase family 108 protein n=1 Tax=Brucella abortus TaxID=235 RepID=UPI0004E87677|nr:glycosyl hydrolase 108 family protein [Brucella abortus]KFH18557.1 hypothetical protein IB60_16275 [Brucella abortus LMN1]KFH24280.1 hypothetical protein IB61_11515 [Brucella abortus LMN2]RUQ67086.1 hypothetical protein ELZ23_16070 [Brucella abortus]RUQ78166.1 hypothetical protein ELZ22_17280 [Brucella abortus]RUQ88189.1 hypothetical protein ELZ18_16145 [Brucella abortus]